MGIDDRSTRTDLRAAGAEAGDRTGERRGEVNEFKIGAGLIKKKMAARKALATSVMTRYWYLVEAMIG